MTAVDYPDGRAKPFVSATPPSQRTDDRDATESTIEGTVLAIFRQRLHYFDIDRVWTVRNRFPAGNLASVGWRRPWVQTQSLAVGQHGWRSGGYFTVDGPGGYDPAATFGHTICFRTPNIGCSIRRSWTYRRGQHD